MKMKMKREHYREVKEGMLGVECSGVKCRELISNGRRLGMEERVIRWSLYRVGVATKKELVEELGQYLSDDQIDVALRRVMEEVENG